MGRDQESLQNTYSSLALFSDLDWKAVSQEFFSLPPLLTFPEYLQEKAEAGDCPFYLFELAYYLYALEEVFHSRPDFSSRLNSSAIFMDLEFDVSLMLEKSEQGIVEVIERAHVLCLFKNENNEVVVKELAQNELKYLAEVEMKSDQKNHSMQHLCALGLLKNDD